MTDTHTAAEIAAILASHKLWSTNDPAGSLADLRRAYLRNADLSYAYLAGARLTGATTT